MKSRKEKCEETEAFGWSAKPVVVVVDMQTGLEFKKSTLASVGNLVMDAVGHGCPVIFLELEGAGDTEPGLLRCVAGTSNWERAIKPGMNGAQQVLEVCQRRGFKTELIWMCGIYVDQCVAETVDSLSQQLPTGRILVIKEACATRGMRPSHWHWLMFPRRDNIRRTKGFDAGVFTIEEEKEKSDMLCVTVEKLESRLQAHNLKLSGYRKRLQIKRCSQIQRDYINRLGLWAENSLLRATQFLQQARCLSGPVQFHAIEEDDGPGVTIDGAPLPIAGVSTDQSTLLQLALDDAEHARLALIRAKDYLVQIEHAIHDC